MLTEDPSVRVAVLNDWDRAKIVGSTSTQDNPRTVSFFSMLIESFLNYIAGNLAIYLHCAPQKP